MWQNAITLVEVDLLKVYQTKPTSSYQTLKLNEKLKPDIIWFS